MEILQKYISPDEKVKIISKKEKDVNEIANNLQFNYIIGNLVDINEELLEKYLKEQFVNNLQQFLKQKGYNLTKSPLFKVHRKNFDLINEEKLSIGFLNLMEVDGKKTFLGPEVIEEFETFFFEKLKLLFDINYNIVTKDGLAHIVNNINKNEEEKEEVTQTNSLSL
jgi:hypothetical protein